MTDGSYHHQHLIIQTAIPAVVVTLGLWAWLGRKSEGGGEKNHNKRLHVNYPHPELPFAIHMIAKLPQFVRRPMMIKGGVPKPPLDGCDLVGPDYDPYEYTELVPNKLWRVRYRHVADPALMDALKSLFGIDLADKSILTTIDNETIRKHVEHHQEYSAALATKNEGLDSKQQQCNTLHAGCEASQDMLIARLADHTGDGLLIYNPCRMHSKVIDYLNTLGVVRYIVSGSSVHTNQIPGTATIYKSAKIILAEVAELKCLVTPGMRPADFIYTDHNSDNPRGYHAAVAELEPLGVQLFHVRGDVQTQTLAVIVHGHLFDTDLTSYGNGQRLLHSDEEDWEHPTPALNYGQKYFYAAMQPAVIAGYLPNYRLMGLDPSSPFTKLMLDEPTPSTCQEFATSLRELLQLKFDWVDNVHSIKRGSVSAVEFKESVDKSWNWLDGNSLL